MSAYGFYVIIAGLKDESRRKGMSSLRGLRFCHEVSVPVAAGSGGGGGAMGKRVHGPVTITKEWGEASPQLFDLLVKGSHLPTVRMEFVGPGPDGQEEVRSVVTLGTALITKIHRYVGLSEPGDPRDARELEDVSFVYEKITVESIPGQTSAMDDLKTKA